MKKAYSLTLALGVIVGSLSSCSRANYAFKPQTPSYLGTTQAVAAPAAVATAPEVTVEAPALAVAPVAAATPATATAPVAEPAAKTSLARANSAQVVAQAVAQPVASAAKPTLLQRVAMNKVIKQVAKAEARHQNTASTTHAAAAGTSVTIALVGLAALIIGLIVGSGFLITAGAVVLVVGVVLFIIKSL
jgi:cobalamin biosynthesis Mg chelatase CobN